MTEDDLADVVQRLRFVADNIDSISKRHDCCEQLQVVISMLGGHTTPHPEDRPKPTYASARESAIDEQAAMFDDSDGDASWPDDNTYHFMKE